MNSFPRNWISILIVRRGNNTGTLLNLSSASFLRCNMISLASVLKAIRAPLILTPDADVALNK